MTRTGHAGFTDLSPISANRGCLPRRAGRLRLVFTLCAMFVGAQFLVPLIARLALNGGRVWPTDETHSLWRSVFDERVLSVPAWLTIATSAVGMVAAVWFLIVDPRRAGSDAAYVSLVSVLLFGVFPWAIAALDADPEGVVRTPGAEGYLVGWHAVLSPLALAVLLVGIVVSVRHGRRGGGALSAGGAEPQSGR